jgi:hypothetical protein
VEGSAVSITFTIAPGYHGMCGVCEKDCWEPDVVLEWVEFDNPLPASDLFPQVNGIWQPVHPKCVRPGRKTRPIGDPQ